MLELNQALQRQAERARLAQAHAEGASQAKTRFLANMSHELRSPLNGVIGAAQLLQTQGADAGRRSELVDIIRTSGTNLLGLIEHVLDLARIESGALELQPQDFNLLDCVEAAVMSSAAIAAAKGLRLSCHVDPTLALWRHGDDARLRQLLLNLLGNAVKFTPQGDVSVDVGPCAEADDRIRIHVRDTGVGIPVEALAAVFEPFQQADASTTRRFGGSGLGLAICRDLARLMGGDVTVQSIVGVGSCFTLEVRLAPADHAGADCAHLGAPVAWCEPHEPSARALQAMLQRLGCEAQRRHDTAELHAFLASCAARARKPWFIVAIDSEPGRSLLAACRSRLDPSRIVPVHGGADAAPAPGPEWPGLGRAMARPVLRSGLASRLARSDSVAADARPAHFAAAGRATSARVLLAEDDPINQAVVRSMLQHAGFACTLVGNGASALQQLARTRFDAVLMDWQMPDMDGLEATRRLREGQAGDLNRLCPVVALTANAFAEDRAACLAAGMNDFITKPVLASHLIAVLERWTRDGRTPEPTPQGAMTPPAAPEPGPAVYDPGVLARLPMVADGSDPQYAQQLLRLFVQSSKRILQDIARGAATADLAVVQRAVHALKSSAAQVGGMALAGEAAHAEAQLRRGLLAAEQLPALFERLRQAREAFAEAIPGHD